MKLQAVQYLQRILLIFGDLCAFQISLVLALCIRYGKFSWENWGLHAWPFGIVALLWVVIFYIANLYDLTLTREPLRFIRSYLEAMMVNVGIAVAFFYLLPFFGIAPRTNLFLFFAIGLLLDYGWRLFFNRVLAPKFPRGRVLYVGPASDVEPIDRLLKASSVGMDLVAGMATDGDAPTPSLLRWYTDLHRFTEILVAERITAVVLGIKPEEKPELAQALYRSLFQTVHLLDRTELEEVTTGRIPLSHVTKTWFLHHLRESDKAWYETAKRGGDILLAIPFGIITAVLFPFVALGIKIASPGPVLYSQNRVGKGGKLFRIWKFRSMHVDAEKDGPRFTADAKTDPRLFRLGRILRQLRVDEFPQVWNILRGELSFIGPRPERPEFVEPLVERMPHYALRHLTRPGLTGWAQVRYLKPNATIDDNLIKLQYDLYYIKHRSPLLDLAILLKTVGIMLKRQGT